MYCLGGLLLTVLGHDDLSAQGVQSNTNNGKTSSIRRRRMDLGLD